MAFRRALSIRSTLTSPRKQLPYHITPRDNDHEEEEDSFTSQRSCYHSFLHQRPSISSGLLVQLVTLSCLSRLFSIALIWFIRSQALSATVLIRSLTVPLLIKQMKDTTKLSLMRPRLESIREEMQSKGMDHVTMAEGQKKMKNLFKEYGVTPFTPMKGMLIQGPLFVCFFLAIRNMAEKVPSFQTGGALWFTVLTTPDSLYILPVLTALTFLITVECNAQEGMEGNPMAGTVKNVCRGFALLTVPMTMSFPQAIFCYWITSNLFSLTYGLVIKRPRVKKLLKIPELPPPPPGQQPSFDLFAALKKMKAMTQDRTQNETESP
uniref:Membrane insertase YidC/Oxa/ALB C-terminal domain-containing protein n=1 Tax=Brassica oleracea var. oleracea TaxID=109376 RepID=A0A0D3AYA1_BRAOL